MSSIESNELASFHSFVSDQLRVGRGNVSPEEALDLWRAQHPAPDSEDEETLAVREALEDMRRGDTGLAIDQFDHEFRSRHGLKAE